MKIYIIETLQDWSAFVVTQRVAFKNKKEAEKQMSLMNKKQIHQISEMKLK
jgi:hypothetical protein